MSMILFILSMFVICSTFFMELTEVQMLTYITAWGFLFLGAILSGQRIRTEISLPKELFDDKHN